MDGCGAVLAMIRIETRFSQRRSIDQNAWVATQQRLPSRILPPTATVSDATCQSATPKTAATRPSPTIAYSAGLKLNSRLRKTSTSRPGASHLILICGSAIWGLPILRWGWIGGRRPFVVRGYRMLTEVQGPFSGDPDLYSWMGAALLSVKQNSEAMRAYTRAFELDPSSTLKEADLGLAYASSGESDVAVRYLEDTLTKDPVNLSVATLLMEIYTKQGDTAKAADLTKRMRAAMK